MDVKSTAKTVRVTPRKARLVLDLVRGKSVDEALAILEFTPNKAAEAVYKVVKTAAADATNNFQLNYEQLYVKACYADEGIVMKRFKAAGKGNAHPRMKRTSHITVVVSDER